MRPNKGSSGIYLGSSNVDLIKSKYFSRAQLQTSINSISWEARERGMKFKANLGQTERLCLRKEKKKKELSQGKKVSKARYRQYGIKT